MGISIRLESGQGKVIDEIHDPNDLTTELLADYSDDSSPCLRWIDPYGDTLFNQLQIPFLIQELELTIALVKSQPVKAHGQAIIELIKKAIESNQLYIRFYGD